MLDRAVVTGVAALSVSAFALMAVSVPAEARGGKGLGVAIGIGAAAAIIGGAARTLGAPQERRSRSRGGRRRPASRDDDDSDTPSGKSTQASINTAVDYEALGLIEGNRVTENNRNVDLAVKGFIEVLEDEHQKLRGSRSNVRVSSGTNINQVTAGEVRRLIEEIYGGAGLTQFDRFAGELWTRDRLTVAILFEARRGLAPYFDGVGAKGPSLDDLRDVFAKAAGEVYARALEMSEIVGVSHSFDRFVRTISENSDQAPRGLQTIGADARFERLLTTAINTVPYQAFIAQSAVVASDPKGLKRQFQFRFRARRSLYDCLAANYVEIATGKPKQNETAIPVGLIRIESFQPVATGSRGASIDGAKPPGAPTLSAPGEKAEQNGAAPPAILQDLWERVKDHVNEKCRSTMMTVAEVARSKGLEPQPARWDSYAPAAGTLGQPGSGGLQPINILGPAPQNR
ncbi:MAG: hypothetical protein R3D27_11745 [Hyphomicrobiaceae bacterium]